MQVSLVFIFALIHLCQSNILYRIDSKRKDVHLNSAYIIGAVASHEFRNIRPSTLPESEEVWVETDVVQSDFHKLSGQCAQQSIQWKSKEILRSSSSDFLEKFRENIASRPSEVDAAWQNFLHDSFSINESFSKWNNPMLQDYVYYGYVFDAYRRNQSVKSLLPLPSTCPEFSKSLKLRDQLLKPEFLMLADDVLRMYTCGLISEDLFRSSFNEQEIKSINNRNEQMAQRIHQLLTQKPNTKYFFLVNAVNFLGNQSVVKLLEDQGYSLERVYYQPNPLAEKCADKEFRDKYQHPDKDITNAVTIYLKNFNIDPLFYFYYYFTSLCMVSTDSIKSDCPFNDLNWMKIAP